MCNGGARVPSRMAAPASGGGTRLEDLAAPAPEDMRPDFRLPAWQAGHAVGNALLDRQHMLLISLARSLAQDAPGLDRDAVFSATRDIVSLTERRCAAEEDLLLRNGYEWLEQHRQEHQAGLDRLRALSACAATGALACEAFVAAFVNWLETHMVDMDLPAREYLARWDDLDGGDGPDPLDKGWR